MINASDKSCKESHNRLFMCDNIFPKTVPFMRYVEKYGSAEEAADDSIILGVRIAYCINKATDTHLEYVILLAFTRQ